MLLLSLAFALPQPNPVRSVDEATLASLLRSKHEGALMVNFFTTWCAPCAAEMPMLQMVLAAHPRASAVFVSLDAAGDSAQVQALVDRVGLASPVVHLQATDPAAAMTRILPDWPERIPVTMVFAPDGSLHKRFVGLVTASQLSPSLVAWDLPAPNP